MSKRHGCHLPVEIWLFILQYATHVPTELGIAEWGGNYDQLDLGRVKLSEIVLSVRALRREGTNRLNLSLVCRQWYNIMEPILHRSVTIGTQEQLETFFEQVDDPEKNVARFVRRIDVSWYNLEEGPDLLHDLLEACPNLVFINDSSYDTQPTVHTLLGEYFENNTSRHNLPNSRIQQLHCDDLQNIETPPHWISPFSCLRALYLGQPLLAAVSTATPLSFPLLEVLDISDMPNTDVDVSLDGYMAQSSLPQLHSVSISFFRPKPHKLPQFWRRFGPQIRTLRIHDTCSYRYDDHFSQLPPHFSSLEQLIVTPFTHRRIIAGFSSNSTITRFELDLGCEGIEARTFGVDIPSLFPKLKRFQFSNIPTWPMSDDFFTGMWWVVDFIGTHGDALHSSGVTICKTLDDGRDLPLPIEHFKKILKASREDD